MRSPTTRFDEKDDEAVATSMGAEAIRAVGGHGQNVLVLISRTHRRNIRIDRILGRRVQLHTSEAGIFDGSTERSSKKQGLKSDSLRR